MDDSNPPLPRLRTLVLLAADLAGFTTLARSLDALELARTLDTYYRAVDQAVRDHGGRVVKFMGDATLAVFPDDAVLSAIDCARAISDLHQDAGGLATSVNVHRAEIAEANLGPQARYDVVGQGVNATFLLGDEPGIRISESVYVRLDDDQRAGWSDEGTEGVYRWLDGATARTAP